MTTASIIQTHYNPPQSVGGFSLSLATAFNSAGFGNAVDAWVASNGDLHSTFSLIGNANVEKGRIILDVVVTNQASATGQRQIFTNIYDSWNSATHVGTNGSNTYDYGGTLPRFSIENGQPLTLTAIAHPELKIVTVQQSGYGPYYFGILRPALMPGWWDENAYPYFFMATYFNGYSSGNLIYYSPLASTLNPYNNAGYLSILRDASFANGNPLNNKRDIFPGLTLINSTTMSGVAGQTSPDLCLACGNNASFLDILPVTSGVEEYKFITPGGSPGIVVRTT